MVEKKRLTIGLLISDLADDYDRSIIAGVTEEAENKDVNLVVFPGRYLSYSEADNERKSLEYQYNAVFSYAKENTVDALIIMYNSICSRVSEEERKEFIDYYKDIPSVILAGKVDGHTCINYDNEKGLYELISHLIVDKGKKKIAFVSGPKNNPDADMRLNVYRKVLKDQGIEIDDNLIAYGDFTKHSENVVDELLDSNPDIEAIAFANDTMAIGGYEAIKKHNLVIGKDILVTGFDDSPASLMLNPVLTTVKTSLAEAGKRCIDEAIALYNTKETKDIIIDTVPLYRESTNDDADKLVVKRIKEELGKTFIPDKDIDDLFEKIETLESADIGQVAAVQKIVAYLYSAYRKDRDDDKVAIGIVSKINRDAITRGNGDDYSYVQMLDKIEELGFNSAYLYALSHPLKCDKPTSNVDYFNPEYFLLKAYYTKNEGAVLLNSDEQVISNSEVLTNKYIDSNKRHTLYVFRLFTKNEVLGMFVCEPSKNFIQNLYILINQLSITFKTIYLLKEHVLIHQNLNESLRNAEEKNEFLSYLSETDPLTGLANRRYLKDTIDRIKADASYNGVPGIVGMIDMNNLKLINDTFSHEEGDKAIINSANVIKKSLRSSEIVVRAGGDEFVILIPDRQKLTVELLHNRIHSNFEEFNEKSKESYFLEASVGLKEFEWTKDINFEELLKEVDKEMYKEKAKKKNTIMK